MPSLFQASFPRQRPIDFPFVSNLRSMFGSRQWNDRKKHKISSLFCQNKMPLPFTRERNLNFVLCVTTTLSLATPVKQTSRSVPRFGRLVARTWNPVAAEGAGMRQSPAEVTFAGLCRPPCHANHFSLNARMVAFVVNLISKFRIR